jgi:hypothetical protein
VIAPAQLILASSAIPFIIYGTFIIKQGESVEGTYSIIGGIYTFFAIMFIPMGFPGAYVFPVSISITALGGMHSYMHSKNSVKLIKAVILFLIAIGILISQVVL